MMAWNLAVRPLPFAFFGTLSGAIAAASTFLPIGTFPGIAIAGYCFGIEKTGSGCDGIEAAFYVFPGLVFGLVFGLLLRLSGELRIGGAALYAVAAAFANSVAVGVCVWLVPQLDALLPIENVNVATALAGLIAGGVGGGLLGGVLAVLNRRARYGLPLAAGAGLGVLAPLILHLWPVGDFAFYLLWQSGYAAALAMSLSPAVRARPRWLQSVPVLRWLRTGPPVFALCGIASGAATATACTLAKFGEVEPFAIAGYCLGVQVSGAGIMQGGACSGIDGAFYLVPGLVFGIVFGPLLHRCGRLSRGGVTLYALAAVMANAIAVTVCVSALHPIDDLLPFSNPIFDLAVAGIIAGAAGSGVLGMIFHALDGNASLRSGIVVAGSLGMLTPLIIMFDAPGGFAFYMIWQGGYAAAVAAGLAGEG